MLSRCVLPFIVLLFMLPTSASAQSISQSIDVIGWSATGNEIISKVTLGSKGIDAMGNPVDWQYTVVEVLSTRNGKVLSRFKSGPIRGPEQKGWQNAKGEEEGKKRLEALGVLPALESPVSPDGAMALVTYRGLFPQEMEEMDAKCPGCNTCTSTLQTHIIHRDDHKVYKLRLKQRTGNPYPPDEGTDDCPKLTTRAFWHPQARRFALVNGESIPSSGNLMQTLRTYDPSSESGAWKSTDINQSKDKVSRQDRIKASITQYKDMMSSTSDPLDKAILLTSLGDLNRRLGEIENAKGYYGASLDLDKGNTRAVLGLAMVAQAEGDVRAAARNLRKAQAMDRRIGLHHADFGLFFLVAGKLDKAEKAFKNAAASEAGFGFKKKLDLGQQLLDIDLNQGLRFLGEALDEAPEAPDEALVGPLRETALRLIEESITAGRLDVAVRHLTRLDTKSDEARRYALLLAAMRTDSQNKLGIIIERAGNLLEENPNNCGLYHVRGVAMTRARRPHEAMTHHAAAIACDPSLLDAQLAAADLFRTAGRIPLAMKAYEAYLNMATPRLGDAPRDKKRREIRQLLQRLGHSGIVVLGSDCNPRGAEIFCRGRLRNTSGSPSGAIKVELSAWTGDKRPELINTGRTEIPQLAAGATVEFQVTLTTPDGLSFVLLTAGSNDEERKLNESSVSF